MWRCVKGSGRAKEKREPLVEWFSLDAKKCTGSICTKGLIGYQGSEGQRQGPKGLT